MTNIASLFCKPNTGITVYYTKSSNSLGKLMVTTQLLLATSFSSPQLWISIMSSRPEWQLEHPLHLPCQVQFFLEWQEMPIPQALRSDHSPLWRPVGIFYICHSQTSLSGLFLHITRLISLCVHLISKLTYTYSEPSVGLLFALYRQH